MALLTTTRAGRLALLALLSGLTGCSALLDPDDLRVAGDVVPDVASDVTPDPGADPGPPGVDISVTMPGAGSCTLVYEEPAVLGCPQSCPAQGGWELTFDGSDSTGVQSWDWQFVASSGWVVVEARDDDTARPTVVVDLDTPETCPTGFDVKSGFVTVRLGVNGGSRAVVGDLSLAVSESGGCAQANQCAPPP